VGKADKAASIQDSVMLLIHADGVDLDLLLVAYVYAHTVTWHEASRGHRHVNCGRVA